MTGPRVIPARAPCARASPTRPRRAARTSRGVATRALPPANEVAGFVIGVRRVAIPILIPIPTPTPTPTPIPTRSLVREPPSRRVLRPSPSLTSRFRSVHDHRPQGGLVALVLSINKLDAVIARAQVRGFEESSGKKGTTRSPSGGGGGNIFVVPDDDDDDDDDDDARTP
jgi:hypothetical protein